jgi:phage terminase small subunit
MKLTPKQEKFCHEYLVDMNGTQAAIRAGYSVKTANEQASALLAKLNIQQRIKQLSAPIIKKLDVSKERLINELARIGFSDLRNYFNGNGELKPIKDLDDDAAAALSSAETEDLFQGFGKEREQIGYTRKIKLWGKLDALAALAKIMDYNPAEKKDITVNKTFEDYLNGDDD